MARTCIYGCEGLTRAAHTVGLFGSQQLIEDVSSVQPLTAREMDILESLRRGLSRTDIATEQFISVNTVKGHIQSLGRKLGVSGQAEIVSRANELRL